MKATVADTRMAAEKSEGKKVCIFDLEEDLAVALAKYTADLSDKVSKTRSSFTVDLWLSHHCRRHSKDSETWFSNTVNDDQPNPSFSPLEIAADKSSFSHLYEEAFGFLSHVHLLGSGVLKWILDFDFVGFSYYDIW
ncbi:hypothetical protein SLA2020_472800 [Shorea laevis]